MFNPLSTFASNFTPAPTGGGDFFADVLTSLLAGTEEG